MEIRLKAVSGTPHYLAELCFIREGDKIIIQVADDNNYEKARYDIDAARFKALVDLLLAEGF